MPSEALRPGVPRPPRRNPSLRTVQPTPHFLPVSSETSAGGVVVDVRDGQPYAAIIARRNRSGKIEWCLPKGHLEGRESPEEAALREVAEETGIHGRIIRHLASIDYWFSGADRRIHKVVHHYLMGYISGSITVEGDPDHEAEDAAWVPLRDLTRERSSAAHARSGNPRRAGLGFFALHLSFCARAPINNATADLGGCGSGLGN